MSKLNLLIFLNAYNDSVSSNNPSLNLFKWSRELIGLDGSGPESSELSIGPGETEVLVDGQRTLSNNASTVFDLELKPGSSNLYRLKYISGTDPVFRVTRTIGGGASTVVDVTKVGNFVTYTSVSGPLFTLIPSVQVGDEVVISNVFNALNRGKFKVLARTMTSFTVENPDGVAETGVTLSSVSNIRIFSASGVQKGDKLRLVSGFNPINLDTYEITYVENNLVEFFSSKTLPTETGITGPTFNIYYDAKKLIYLETNKKLSVTVNGVNESDIEPFIDKKNVYPGIFLKRSTVWSLEITNNTSDVATVFFATIE